MARDGWRPSWAMRLRGREHSVHSVWDEHTTGFGHGWPSVSDCVGTYAARGMHSAIGEIVHSMIVARRPCDMPEGFKERFDLSLDTYLLTVNARKPTPLAADFEGEQTHLMKAEAVLS